MAREGIVLVRARVTSLAGMVLTSSKDAADLHRGGFFVNKWLEIGAKHLDILHVERVHMVATVAMAVVVVKRTGNKCQRAAADEHSAASSSVILIEQHVFESERAV